MAVQATGDLRALFESDGETYDVYVNRDEQRFEITPRSTRVRGLAGPWDATLKRPTQHTGPIVELAVEAIALTCVAVPTEATFMFENLEYRVWREGTKASIFNSGMTEPLLRDAECGLDTEGLHPHGGTWGSAEAGAVPDDVAGLIAEAAKALSEL